MLQVLDDPDAEAQPLIAEMEPIVEQSHNQDAEARPYLLVLKGMQAERAGDWKGAIATFTEVAKLLEPVDGPDDYFVEFAWARVAAAQKKL